MTKPKKKTLSVTPSIADVKARVIGYSNNIISGQIPANRWVYAAAKRFETDLLREDIYMDWEEVVKLNAFFESLRLIGEWSDQQFKLHDWQLFTVANIICFKFTQNKKKRFKLNIVQVARGNGKTTLMAALGLYDFLHGEGKRISVIANNEQQATLTLDTAKTMLRKLLKSDMDADIGIRWDRVSDKDRDCVFEALPAQERSLDGRNDSLWIADECAEYKGRFLTKLLTTGAKRTQSSGILITTPGSNSESHYAEIVKQCEGVLDGTLEDDSIFALLYGIDSTDKIEEDEHWIKANPGLLYGQPELASLKRSLNTMKQSPMGRSEFTRYHCSRVDDNTGGWLDMELWSSTQDPTFDWKSLENRPCYGGLDLSKSGDMTAFVLAFPLEDGRIALKGRYWFPSEGLAQRELDYRMPVRTWAREKKLELSIGREIDYEQIRTAVIEENKQFDIKGIGFDAWGSKYLAETLVNDGVPLMTYRMAIATFGPGCQLFQNLWSGKKFIINDDPIMRRAMSECIAKRDLHGNIRPCKSRSNCIIDPLVAAIMAVHSWGGQVKSSYESDEFIQGNL